MQNGWPLGAGVRVSVGGYINGLYLVKVSAASRLLVIFFPSSITLLVILSSVIFELS